MTTNEQSPEGDPKSAYGKEINLTESIGGPEEPTQGPQQFPNLETGLRTNEDLKGYPAAVLIARNKRRGLLGRLTVLAEIENPYHYQRTKKWLITAVVASCGVVGPFSSAITLRK